MGTVAQNQAMMERSDRWRQLLALVRDTYCNGNQAELARRIQKDGNYVNKLFWAPDKVGHKGIGPEIMEACTKVFELPVGFWEMEPRLAGKALGERSASTPATAPAPHEVPVVGGGDPDLVITQYEDTGGAMGHGFNLTDSPPGHIRSWRVTHEWLRLNVPSHTGIKNLAIVTGFGPSMKPMFNPGDPLLVDTGVKVIDHEGVYFFRVGEEGFIKLIQRVPEFDGPGIRLRVISKNPDFPPYDISPKNPQFEVLGKVLTVWRSEQY